MGRNGPFSTLLHGPDWQQMNFNGCETALKGVELS